MASELAQALERLVAEQSTARRREVYEALLRSDLAVALLDTPAQGAGEGLGEDRGVPGGFELLAGRDADGSAALLTFSGARGFRSWGAAQRVAIRPFTEAATAALANGLPLTIDPAGPAPLTVARWELRRLARGEVPDPELSSLGEAEDARVALGPPASSVAELERALHERLAAHAEVVAAWVFEGEPTAARRQLVVGLLLDPPGDEAAGRRLIDDLHGPLSAAAPARTLVNYTLVHGDEKLRGLDEQVPPAYARSRG